MEQRVRIATNLLHLLRHHQAADTWRPAPASPNTRHLHCRAADQLHQEAADTSITKEQTPADQHQYYSLQQTRPCNRHWSSSLSNRFVHNFDPPQQRLRPYHTAIPTICTKHWDHSDFLGVLSPRTYRQSSLHLSVALTFNTAETA